MFIGFMRFKRFSYSSAFPFSSCLFCNCRADSNTPLQLQKPFALWPSSFPLFLLSPLPFAFCLFTLYISVSRSPNVTAKRNVFFKNQKEKASPWGKAFSFLTLGWYQLAETGEVEALYPRIRLMTKSEGINLSSPRASLPLRRVSRVSAI